jgi:predicted nucleic acid-binding protein
VRFLGDLATGNLLAESVTGSGGMRIAELVATYPDLPLRTTDASLIATAERLGIRDIATLDRRHFTVVRSQLGELALLP